MKINLTSSPTNVTTLDDLKRYTSISLDNITSIVNGNIGFTDNCQTSLSSVTVLQALSDTVVTHNLGRIPNGYIVVGNANGMVVRDGVTPPTPSLLTIQGDRVGAVKVLVF